MLNNQLFVGVGNSRNSLLSVSKWNCIISLFLIFGLTSCYKNDIESLQDQINQLKGGEIASIDSQIKAINTSISELKSVDQTLNGYIDALKEDGKKYEQQIASLTEADVKINKRITELQDYTDKQINDTKSWTEATFATIDQLDSLSTVVAGVDAKVGAISASLDSLKKTVVEGYEKAIKDAVSTLETSMKKWVNDQLSGYYTIAQMDATLDSLASAHDSADVKLDKRIDEQKEALETAKSGLTSAYKKAIEEAITDLDGKISDKIATDIATAKGELQGQIDAVNGEITSIKARLKLIETDIEALLDQIQSVVVIPQDVDGSVNVDSDGYCNISFDIKPVDEAKKLAEVWVGLSAEEKAALMTFKIKEISAQGTEVPADTVKTVTFEEDEFKIGVKFANLSDKVLASLQIVYGQSDVASEYFTLYPASKPKNYVSPTSIAVLAVNPIYLTTGTQASIEFRVNPSNATFDMSSENCQLVLDKVGTVQTKSSYVTTPSNYKLAKIEYVFDGETEELKIGQYRAIIEDTEKSAEYDEVAALVLNVKDANGDDVQISSSAFEVIGKNFENLPKTGLPIVVINTPNSEPITSKDEYITGSTISVINSDMTFDLQEVMKIKGRGNSTWGMPKKPYKIKFDSKQSILGEAKDKEWVFLANYSDKTQLRNALAFFMGKNSTLDYTTSYHFVELVLNGAHQGTYMLAEQQKIGKNRVNVGDDGFLLEVDAKAEETDPTFKVKHLSQPINIKDPEVIVGDESYSWVSSYLSVVDSVLYCDNFADAETGYTKYMDDDSFVEWYLINEIARNNDAIMFTSCYMNLSRDGKLKMGPIWDFDIAFGNVNYNDNWLTEGFWVKKAGWFTRLFQDPAFVQKVKNRMAYYYNNKNIWINNIVENSSYIYKSQEANEDIWHTMNVSVWPNYVVCGSYDAEVERLRQWVSDRMDWLYSAINEL